MNSNFHPTHRPAPHAAGPARRIAHWAAVTLLLLVVQCALAPATEAQSPSLVDRTFNTDIGADNDVFAIVSDGNGGGFIGGQFNTYAGIPRGRLARVDGAGQLDPSFFAGPGANNSIYAIARQPDGRLLIGGAFSQVRDTVVTYLARLHPTGDLDTAFSTAAAINHELRAIAVQPDGRILIAGRFTTVAGQSRSRIARLRSNGTLDPDFNPGTGANDHIRCLLLQADGRILIGGQFTLFNGASRARIARLLPTGAVDPSFDPGLGADEQVRTIVTNAAGQIYIGGDFESYNGTNRSSVARLFPNGGLDLTFQPPDSPDDAVRAVAVAPDGKVWIGGQFSQAGNIYRRNLARLHPNGSVDTFFDPPGLANDEVFALEFSGPDRLLIGGKFTFVDTVPARRLARLNPESRETWFQFASQAVGEAVENAGTLELGILRRGWLKGPASASLFTRNVSAEAGLDFASVIPPVSFEAEVTFGVAKIPLIDDPSVEGLEWFEAVLVNSSLPPPGLTNEFRRCRIDDNESPADLDEAFNPEWINGPVFATAVQNDGRTVIGGGFQYQGGCLANSLERLEPSGVLDCDFWVHSTGANGPVHALSLDLDGRIIAGGSFTYFNSQPRAYLVRLQTDGSTDSGFRVGTSLDGPVYAIERQPDGRILIGGDFTRFGDGGPARLARLHPDGSLDTSFTPVVTGGSVTAIRWTAGGSILIAGGFTTVNGTPCTRVARLHPTGILDTGFAVVPGPDGLVRSLVEQTNGRIVLAGDFANVGGAARKLVARLHPNGTLDATFDAGSIDSLPPGLPSINAVAVQSDGRIVLGGRFQTIAGILRPNLARLDANGALDTVFLSSNGANDEVFSVQAIPNGPLLVAGAFTAINGVNRMRVARIDPDSTMNRITLKQSSLTVSERDGSADIEVRRTGPSAQPVSVRFNVRPDTALAGTDFLPVPNEVTLAPLETVRVVRIPLVNDGLPESAERFEVALGPEFSGARPGLVTNLDVEIIDNDRGVGFTDPTLNLREGTSGVWLSVLRGSDGPTTVTVDFATENGTALAGIDYVPTNGVLTFPPGVFEQTIHVSLLNQPEFEGRETFRVRLSNPSPASEASLDANSTATVSIEDQDSSFEFFGVFDSVENDGIAMVTILRRGEGLETASLRVRSNGGTATPGLDFIPVDFVLTFGPGETGAAFYVTNLNDGLVEGPEFIRLVMEPPTGRAIIQDPGEVLLEITDNDTGIEWTAAVFHGNEFAPHARLTVRRGDDGASPLSVSYRAVASPPGGAEAVANEDFVPSTGTILLPPGETNALVLIPLLQDKALEVTESFRVQLEAPSDPGRLGTQMVATVKILDDERAGSLDLDFLVDPRNLDPIRWFWFPNGPVQIAPHTGGRLLIGLPSSVARLRSDGTRDETFQPPATSFFTPTLRQLSNGRIAVGGSSSNDFSGTGSYCLQMLEPNGSKVAEFAFPIYRGRAAALAPLNDGRILVGGDLLTAPFGGSAFNLIQVLPGGALDPSFAPVSFNSFNGFFIPPSTVEALAVQPDGRVLAAGTFNSLAGTARSKIARLLANGTPDPSFSSPPVVGTAGSGGPAFFAALALQTDGRILVGGQFTNVGGMTAASVIRFLPDGALDPSFRSPLTPAHSVSALALQPDGRLVVVGSVAREIDGAREGLVTRLLPDGQLDSAFSAGLPPDQGVTSVALLPGGDIAIAGPFKNVNGIDRPIVARLKGDGLRLDLEPAPNGAVRLHVRNTVADGITILESSADLKVWSAQATNTASGPTQEFLLPTTPAGHRFLRARHTAP